MSMIWDWSAERCLPIHVTQRPDLGDFLREHLSFWVNQSASSQSTLINIYFFKAWQGATGFTATAPSSYSSLVTEPESGCWSCTQVPPLTVEAWIWVALSLSITVTKPCWSWQYWDLTEKGKARLSFRGKWSYQGKALEGLEIFSALLDWSAQVCPLV